MTTERKKLIERLRDYTYEGDPRHLMEQAADMLEADAVPQEPVAILNHAHGVHAIRSVNIAGLPDGEYKLYTAPQPRQRLTDAEIIDLAVETNLGRKLKPLGLDTGEVFYTDASYKTGALIDFARKVRGEA